MKLFICHPDNKYKIPLQDKPDINDPFWVDITRCSLIDGWKPLTYSFYVSNRDKKKGWGKTPEICMSTAGFVFRADLLDEIFPIKPAELEFLPVLVDGKDWLLLNCLRTTKGYDANQSILFRRGEHNQIFMVNHLVLNDKTVDDVGLFTIDDSNRGFLFVIESFVDWIKQLGFKGVDFREIGYINP